MTDFEEQDDEEQDETVPLGPVDRPLETDAPDQSLDEALAAYDTPENEIPPPPEPDRSDHDAPLVPDAPQFLDDKLAELEEAAPFFESQHKSLVDKEATDTTTAVETPDDEPPDTLLEHLKQRHERHERQEAGDGFEVPQPQDESRYIKADQSLQNFGDFDYASRDLMTDFLVEHNQRLQELTRRLESERF